MAEVVLRRHKRRNDRWLPRERRWYVTKVQVKTWALLAAKGTPGLLLSFAEMLGIPSGLHGAFGAALAVCGLDVRPTVVGCCAGLLLRLLSGLAIRWEMLPILLMIGFAPWIFRGRVKVKLPLLCGLTMLPTAVASCLSATAAQMLQGLSAVAVTAMSAPVFVRAVQVLKSGRHITSMEERVAVGYLAAMCLCGGARILLLTVNLGVLLTACGTLLTAMILGVSAGVLTGLLGGMVMALQGLPVTVSVALALGGFLAGVCQSLGRRRLTCGVFAMGTYLPMVLCGGTSLGSGAAILAAAVTVFALPRAAWEHVQHALRRFLNNDPPPGDAYAAAALSAWEQTVAALARAVPSPKETEGPRDGAWWEAHLCQGCPSCEGCGCMTMPLGVEKAEQVWAYRHAAEEVWQGALEGLRGLGCQRLYFLRDAMNGLRREAEAADSAIRQGQIQRDMLVTHLTAMSGAVRRFAALSAGDSWWDSVAARRIRKEIAERAMPASLSYVRRVQGHARAAFTLQFITGARQQAEELALLSSAVMERPMELSQIDGDRVLLVEKPLFMAEVGSATAPITGGEVCGDTGWSGILQDGRCLVALSDGMGHGEPAALSSRQTVELLRLCMEAGYSRRQTLMAVNGMLLLGGGSEQFATADMLIIDLWQGDATLDKLGAAASWLYQQGQLTRLTGDGLPLGILEDVAQDESSLRLSPGDAVLLLSDGVEDAFRSVSGLEKAVRSALGCETAQEAADTLLQAAALADEDQRRDDQSVVVVYIRKRM